MGVRNTKLASGGEVAELQKNRSKVDLILEWAKAHPLRIKMLVVIVVATLILVAIFTYKNVTTINKGSEDTGVNETLPKDKIDKALEELKAKPDEVPNSTFQTPISDDELQKIQSEEYQNNFTGVGTSE